MKFLKKLKNGNFWISIISAGVLIAEVVFDFEIKTEYLNQILLGLMGVLTMFGIITDHGASEKTDSAEASPENVSNIKSICDTISLMLNKVSINSNSTIDNLDSNIASETENLSKEDKTSEENNCLQTEEVNAQSVEADNIETVEEKIENKEENTNSIIN